VVGTVRSRAKAEATRTAIAKVAPVDKLTFVETNLLSDTGWDAAMQGCGSVLHVASPVVLAEPKQENDLIGPAAAGTKHVVSAARRAGVKRLVLTPLTVSISSGEDIGRYDFDAWSDTRARIGAYAKSKTLAERAAWAIAKGGDMELAVITPGAVFGPSIGAHLEGVSDRRPDDRHDWWKDTNDQCDTGIIRRCMLTGARCGEARTATFDQFNLDLTILTKQAA
jgi:dihydroflavonol-4-reductase